MPGHMLIASCPCGFSGQGDVGATLSPEPTSYIPAYDPQKCSIITVSTSEAVERNLITYPPPYEEEASFNCNPSELSNRFPPLRYVLFTCPKCGNKTMRFRVFGMLD